MKRRTLAVLILIVLCSCTRERLPRPGVGASGIAATFFDVGQGDAAVLRTAEGRTVVFDTGDDAETAALLRREGVSRIDLLVLSHPHADHTGGLRAVLKTFPVTETWYAGEWRGQAARALAAGNPRRVAAGEVRRMGSLALAVLHPPARAPRRRRARESGANDGSLVVKAVYRESRYLFPGDCELGCWEQMFRTRRGELRAEVLKAAHHGSWNGTNSGVLGSVRPETVVISCGRENRYGHPHPVVLKMLERAGATVLRTDRDGTVRCAGTECRGK